MRNNLINFLKKHYILFLDIYLISIFLKSSTLIIDYPVIHTFEKILRVIAFVLMIMRCIVLTPELLSAILKTNWKEKNLKEKILIITIIVMASAIIINTIKIRSVRLLSIALVIISAYKVDLRRILKNILIMQLGMTFFIITSSILEITQDYTISRLNESIVRHSLGFTYPTNLPQITLFISLTYIYLKKFKVRWLDIFMLQILNIYAFYLTNSKTEILVFELLIIICFLIRLEVAQKMIPIISRIATKVYILIPILSLTLVLLYPVGGVMKTVNKALSGRLLIQSKVVAAGNIKLFGTNTQMVGYGLEDSLKHNTDKEYNYIDNDYIQILVVNGIVVALSLIIILYLLLLKLDREQKYGEVIYIYIYLLFGILNPRVVELMYSPVLFFIIPTLFSNKIKE